MAFAFSGSKSIIRFANPYRFNHGDAITCAFYFYRPASAPNLFEYILSPQINNDTTDSAGNTNASAGYALVLPNNAGGTKARLLGFTDGDLFITETSSNDFNESRWEIYVISFNGNMNATGQSKIWRDGSSKSVSTTISADNLVDNDGIWTIGGRYNSGTGITNNVFTGKIEYIAIWKEFLHDDEAIALTLKTSPLKVRQKDLVFFINGKSQNDFIDVINGRKGEGLNMGYVRGPAISYY